MTIKHNEVDRTKFNKAAKFPYELRPKDFEIAMQDVYDFFHDVNGMLLQKGLQRFDDMLRPANMSGMLSDMLSTGVAKHSRSLTDNTFFNGHPDLVLKGKYEHNSVQAGEHGVEIKATKKRGGAVDFHGARDQWLCVFVYRIDNKSEPVSSRIPLTFTEIYLGQVAVADFRLNARRSTQGTRTATLHKNGLVKFRKNWIYRL
jgi:hypothetical protein